MQGFHFVANSFKVAMTAQRPFWSGVILFSAGNLFVTSCMVIRKDLDLTESTKIHDILFSRSEYRPDPGANG